MSLYLGDQQIAGINTPVQGRVLGQIIHSLIPLNDAGLHLADGSLIDGNGSYKNFYDYMENLYNNTSTITSNGYLLNCYSRNNITLSDDWIASSFGTTNYLKIPNGRVDNSEFVVKFRTGSDITTTQQRIIHCEYLLCVDLGSSSIYTWDWTTNSARTILDPISANTDYWIKIIVNGTTKTFYTSTDGINYTQRLTYSDSSMSFSSDYECLLGLSSSDYTGPFLGSIDLKETYVKANNKYQWKPVIFTKGSFIEEEDYQYLYEHYNACGKFVIDTINKTIKLPYINNIIQGTLDNGDIGKLIEPGLPNITGSSLLYGGSDASDRGVVYNTAGAFYTTYTNTVHYASTGSTKSVSNSSFRINARLSNGIYSNSNTVQPQAVKAYIYIVIATLTKTDIEVDIDEVMTDLNTLQGDLNTLQGDVNNKADKDFSNCTDSDKINLALCCFPKHDLVTLTLGSSGTVYTMSADGWLYLSKQSSANNQYVNFSLVDSSDGYLYDAAYYSTGSNRAVKSLIPVRKGWKVTITYNLAGTADAYFFLVKSGV